MEIDPHYELFQPDVLGPEKLRNLNWFLHCLSSYAGATAARYGCRIQVSRSRLIEAYHFVWEDLDRNLDHNTKSSTTALDHFKHAGFVCFWIRRLLPIIEVRTVDSAAVNQATRGMSGAQIGAAQNSFFGYGNEIFAFTIGWYITAYFESQRIDGEDVVKLRELVSPIDTLAARSAFLSDIVMTMKRKNNSPHSLYLLYKSFFQGLHY